MLAISEKETPFIPVGSCCFCLTAKTCGEKGQKQGTNITKAAGAKLAQPKADPD